MGLGLSWSLSQRGAYEIESRSGEVGVPDLALLPFLTLPWPHPRPGDLHERKSEGEGQPPALKSQAAEKKDEAKPE